MEKNKDEELAEIEKAINELPEKVQRAVCWMIAHFDLVEELCKNPGMTDEEIQKYKEDALAKEDYIMLVLLCVAQIYEKSSETKEQEN